MGDAVAAYLTATFATNGPVVTTQALPLSAFDPTSGSITVAVPASLPAGTYTVSLTLVTASGTFTSSAGTVTIGASGLSSANIT